MKKQKGKMGLSVGYAIPEGGAEYIKDGNYWQLKEIDLWEVSPTPFPMNDLARVETVKSIRDFEEFLRESGFSKSEAIRIASNGFERRDSAAEITELAEMINKNINILTSEGG